MHPCVVIVHERPWGRIRGRVRRLVDRLLTLFIPFVRSHAELVIIHVAVHAYLLFILKVMRDESLTLNSSWVIIRTIRDDEPVAELALRDGAWQEIAGGLWGAIPDENDESSTPRAATRQPVLLG